MPALRFLGLHCADSALTCSWNIFLLNRSQDWLYSSPTEWVAERSKGIFSRTSSETGIHAGRCFESDITQSTISLTRFYTSLTRSVHELSAPLSFSKLPPWNSLKVQVSTCFPWDTRQFPSRGACLFWRLRLASYPLTLYVVWLAARSFGSISIELDQFYS